ncbi:stage III sporulation protein AG [Clostridium sp. CAG:921]|nr:stage III sporulation protein AG [Clostridium sp. CAG:921]
MNYLETIKNITKDKEKRTQNLVLLVILLVILLISINLIFDKNSNNESNITKKAESDENVSSVSNNIDQTDLEKKLENILSQISGISDVSVVLTYSQDTKQNVVYNTKEEIKDGNSSKEASVAYNETSGSKTAIVESVELPKIEGAIVVAKGANSVEIRSKIASAISSVTNIAAYKVQVFEKQG